MNVMLHMKGLY